MDSLSEEITLLIIATGFITVIIISIVIIVVVYQRKQQFLLQAQENERILFSQTLLQAQIEIQEQTLTNISQELHDNIGQTLTVAKLNLSTIQLENKEESLQKIDTSKQLITQSLVNIRDLAKSMLGEKIAEIGLQQAIQNELKILENTGLYTINFSIDKSIINITQQHELIAFRIIQETLHNIVKHAEATTIDVGIKHVSEQIIFTVTDNGKGFNANKLNENSIGIGLKNMKSRAALINASLQIDSAVLKGTITTLTLKE